MKRVKKIVRRSVQKSGLLVGVASMSVAGAYTGMTRSCEARDVLHEFCLEMASDAPNRRSSNIWTALAALTAVSHALGHFARDGWDLRDLRDVMGDFKDVMGQTAARVV